jgi:cytochrome P450
MELTQHPDILARLTKEIDDTLGPLNTSEGDKGQGQKEAGEGLSKAVERMPYLQCVLKEALRLHPPAPIFSRTNTQVRLIGQEGRAGMCLLWSSHAVSGHDKQRCCEANKPLSISASLPSRRTWNWGVTWCRLAM